MAKMTTFPYKTTIDNHRRTLRIPNDYVRQSLEKLFVCSIHGDDIEVMEDEYEKNCVEITGIYANSFVNAITSHCKPLTEGTK